MEIITSNYPMFLLSKIKSARSSISVFVYVCRWIPLSRSDGVFLIVEALSNWFSPSRSLRFLYDYPVKHKPNYHANRFSALALRDLGFSVRFLNSRSTQHSKVWIFDNDSIIIGSHNLVPSSVRNPNEVSLFIDNPSVVSFLSSKFNTLWASSVNAH